MRAPNCLCPIYSFRSFPKAVCFQIHQLESQGTCKSPTFYLGIPQLPDTHQWGSFPFSNFPWSPNTSSFSITGTFLILACLYKWPFHNVNMHDMGVEWGAGIWCGILIFFYPFFFAGTGFDFFLLSFITSLSVRWGSLCFPLFCSYILFILQCILTVGFTPLVALVHQPVGHLEAMEFQPGNKQLLHYSTWHCITLHIIALHYIALHYITYHCIALHCITFHYITLHSIASHHTTLHHIISYHIISYYIILYYI